MKAFIRGKDYFYWQVSVNIKNEMIVYLASWNNFWSKLATIIFYFYLLPQHSAVSFNELPDIRAMQTAASEVHASVVTGWQPACLHKLLPGGHQSGNWRNLQIKYVSNLINICLTKLIQLWSMHGSFKILLMSFKWYVLHKYKKINVGIRAPWQREEVC